MVETEIGFKIKELRTNRGGEFNSNEFDQFCKTHGIKRQLTAAYTSQQNGVVECKNRTMMNLVRSTLSEKAVPKTFWPEAVKWIIYLLNHSPTMENKEVTPEEMWTGIKATVNYFRGFGGLGHVHIPDSMRTKLEDKIHLCVFRWINEESKAYRLYDPKKEKIVISRDVLFEEDKQWS